jgi:ABC-type antimicrobial peptide transport system permease subunit
VVVGTLVIAVLVLLIPTFLVRKIHPVRAVRFS